MSWMLPESFSTFGGDIDRIYYIILWITGIAFFLSEGILVYFLFRYRHKEGRKAKYVHGNTRAEIVWTAGTALIVFIVGMLSIGVWSRVRTQLPQDAMEVIVSAKQFEWNVTYPGQDGVIGTEDDFTKRNEVHAVVDRPIIAYLRAEDVIHSFFLPDLRVKQDAVPGMETPVWFEATETGEYVVGCAELCGLGHYRMAGTLTVHTAADYQAWEQAEIQAAGQ